MFYQNTRLSRDLCDRACVFALRLEELFRIDSRSERRVPRKVVRGRGAVRDDVSSQSKERSQIDERGTREDTRNLAAASVRLLLPALLIEIAYFVVD